MPRGVLRGVHSTEHEEHMTSPTLPPAVPQQAPVAARPDTRPKRLALTSLILAIAGFVVATLGFIPVAVASVVFVVVSGLLLLTALILAIVALASRKQGGKPLGIAALIVSIAGGIVWATALVAALVFSALAIAGPNVTSADSSAYLATVRPEIVRIIQEDSPTATADQIDSVYTDEMLISLGMGFATLPDPADARAAFVSTAVSSGGGALDEAQAGRIFDVLYSAGTTYLR